MSSVTEDDDEIPMINYDTSKGSSVSSGLQEEYDELLKYAIVTPKWEPRVAADREPIPLPQLRLEEHDRLALTTVDEYSESSSRSDSHKVDGHDSAVGSEEIASDRKTFREMQDGHPSHGLHLSGHSQPPLQSTSRMTSSHRAEMSSSIFDNADPDLKQMNVLLQQWHAKTNHMALAELSQIKMGLVETHKREVHTMQQEHDAQMTKLQDEIENLKELLHTYESSLARKDSVISNLTRAMQTCKERQDMARAMSHWKLRLVDERRQGFTTRLARRYRQHRLTANAWQAWRSLIEGKWKEKVEKACQRKAQEICMKLTSDYEARLASADEALDSARVEVRRLHGERDKYEETMKKAFMRGVCALNLEAMTMFHGEEEPSVQQDVRTLAAAVDALSCQSQSDHPHEVAQAPPQSREVGQRSGPVRVQPEVHGSRVKSAPIANQTSSQPQPGVSPYQQQTSTRQPSGVVIRRPASRTRTLTAIVTGANRSQSPSRPPAGSVVIERHHPNIQNSSTGQPLAHVTKEPNTPTRPFRSRGEKRSDLSARPILHQ